MSLNKSDLLSSRLKSAINASPIAILMINKDQQIVLSNNQAVSLFGYTEEELNLMSINNLVPNQFRHKHSGLVEGFMSDAFTRKMGEGKNLYCLTKDQKEIPVEIGLNLTETDEGLMILASITDITERLKYQNEIDERNREIILQQAESNKQLSEKNQQLEQLAQSLKFTKAQQDRLFAIIGHELRTPAAAIKMLVDKSHFDKDLLRDIAEHLLNVLDDMRNVTHPEKATEGIVLKTSVNTVIGKAIQFHDMMLQEAGLEIHFSSDQASKVNCFINAQLLRQIILNLIKNVAFHSKAENLWIIVETEISDQNCYNIRLIDNGKGISKADQEHLFDAFVRGDTQADGTGLGLHLSQRFAREHLNGDLTYEERDGGGSVFTLTIKAQSAEEDLESEAETEQLNLIDGKKILFAEDNVMLQIMSEELLTEYGATVSIAENGLQAWELAQQQDFDLVITDIFMPEMNGYELTAKLRESGYSKPIFAVSAATIGDEIEQILKAGADLAIAKPLTIKALTKALSELS